MTDVDPGDMLVNRQIEDQQRAAEYSELSKQTPVSAPVDPQVKNMAMQLAMQKYPDASIDDLKTHAHEFESYLTEHD